MKNGGYESGLWREGVSGVGKFCNGDYIKGQDELPQKGRSNFDNDFMRLNLPSFFYLS